MKFKNTLIVAALLVAANNTYAQYSGDAFRFSQLTNSTTARFDALGGTKSAVGGDLSSLYGNPAGLGMFTKSEFNLTPSLNLRSGDISFIGDQKKYSGNNADLNNVGVVFHTLTSKTRDTKKGLLSLNLGIGYQRKNAFKNDFNFAGTSNLNGISDFFTENSNREGNGNPPIPDNLVSEANYAAYYGFLTNYQGGRYQNITFADADQTYNVRRSGGSSSIDISFGANVSNKVFLGASVGLSSFKYTSIEKTNEQGLYRNPANNAVTDYNVDYNRNFDSDGSGINLKLGLIFKPINEFRIGLSFESPTFYSVTDNYSEELYDNKQSYSGLDSYPFEYKLNTPLKLNGGLAYFFSSKGFISADVGFVNYSNINFKSDDNRVDQTTNNSIQADYKNVINYSVGGEYNVNNSFLIRLGYKSNGNPYYNLDDKDFTVNSYSGGFGYRFGFYYFDLALVNSNSLLYYSSYALNSGNEPVATIDTRRNNVSLTFGLRF